MIKTNQIALFGGTFDPIHFGHIQIADWLCDSKDFEKVIIIPSGAPSQRMASADGKDRLAMVKLAFREQITHGEIEISECEINRSGFSYAIDTVGEIQSDNPDSKLIWVIGSDAFAKIGTWHEIATLAKKIEFLVITRPGANIVAPPNFIKWQVRDIDTPDISASEIRRRIKDGESLSNLLPDSVTEYIRENGLYEAA